MSFLPPYPCLQYCSWLIFFSMFLFATMLMIVFSYFMLMDIMLVVLQLHSSTIIIIICASTHGIVFLFSMLLILPPNFVVQKEVVGDLHVVACVVFVTTNINISFRCKFFFLFFVSVLDFCFLDFFKKI
jgi:hypothetical protein